jgi:TolB protein
MGPLHEVSFALALWACSAMAAEPPSAPTAQLVFSVKIWDGEYASKDVPGGVETTQVVGAIYRINADGSGLKKLVQLGKNTDYPTFSPDGNWVYFQSNALGYSHIYRCAPDGSKVTNLTAGNRLGQRWRDAYGYALSRDGRRLLYTVHDGSTGRVALADADGGNPRLLFPDLGYIYMGALSPRNATCKKLCPSCGARSFLLSPQFERGRVEDRSAVGHRHRHRPRRGCFLDH